MSSMTKPARSGQPHGQPHGQPNGQPNGQPHGQPHGLLVERGAGQFFAGIDTHKRSHCVAVVDHDGHLVGCEEFGTDLAGCTEIVSWLARWPVVRVGIEQSGTYGAGIAAELGSRGHHIVEVDRPDVTVRARVGKSDQIDAVMAAHAVRTGRARAMAKDRSGVVESVRILHTTRRSAVARRAVLLTQISALAVSAPAVLREQLGSTSRQITTASRRLRADRARLADPVQSAKLALHAIAVQITELDQHIKALDADLAGLVQTVAPRLLARPQVGVNIAAQLLISTGQNIDRITTEAKFARLAGIAPIPVSTGQTHRMRLHRGGDRQANRAIHLVAIGRLRGHQPAIDYLARRTSQGHSKKDTVRAMKRLIARELYGALKADLHALDRL